MAKKLLQQYTCQQCGAAHPKWMGKCTECGNWNSLVQEVVDKRHAAANISSASPIYDLADAETTEVCKLPIGIGEWDRVLGGGLVNGAAILLGGEPGIGKSTLVLQVLARLATQSHNVLYLSGEESFHQIKLRAARLGVANTGIKTGCITELNEIMSAANASSGLRLLVIDSIQTIYDQNIDSAPGSVSQVKSCAFELIKLAKQKGFGLLLIGHVTKEGAIAGPKVLEHMVDTVLYFEGDRGMEYRIVRAVKNRFGPAGEVGIFEMCERGLTEVSNPSQYFLPAGGLRASGSCVFASIEGTRPLLLETQALCVPSYLPSPRRAVVGWDINRLAMLVAVLNARLSINVLDKEVYLNIVGGLKVSEPAADLAVIAALISAAKNKPIPEEYVFFGEVGLSGEVRAVSHTDARVAEAHKLGFKHVVLAKSKALDKNLSCKINLIAVNHIRDLLKILE